MLRRYVYIIVSAGVLLIGGPASATCYWDCELDVMTADCQNPDATFTAGDPIYIWAKCDETCCAPPRREDDEQECSVESSMGAAPSDLIMLTDLFEPLAGDFSGSEHACEGVNLSLFEGELAPGNYVARLEGEFDGAELNVEKAFSVTPGAEAPADKTDEGEGDDEGGCSVSAKADGSGRAWPATSLLLLLFAGTLLLARRARC